MPNARVLIGFLTAFYFLVGRWTLSRLSADGSSDWYREPRLWAVLILAAVVLLDQPSHGVKIAKRPWPKPKLGAYLLAAVACFAYLIESANWSPNAALAHDKAYELTLIIAVVVLLFLSLRQGDGDAIRTEFWRAVVLLTGTMAVFALANTATDRLAVLGGGPNAFGRNMGFLVLGTMYLSRRSRTQWIGIWWALAGLAVLLLLLSGSRGALAAAVVAAVAYQVVDRQPISKRLLLFLGASIVAAVLLTQTESGRKAQQAFAYRVLYLTFDQQYTSGRTELYRQAYDMGRINPVFGVGLNGYRNYVGIYPHNILLEVFAEGGTIGLVLFGSVLLSAGVGLLQMRGRLNAAAVAAAAHAFASAQVSGDLYDSRGIFLLLAFALVPDVMRPRGAASRSRAHGSTSVAPHATKPTESVPAPHSHPVSNAISTSATGLVGSAQTIRPHFPRTRWPNSGASGPPCEDTCSERNSAS